MTAILLALLTATAPAPRDLVHARALTRAGDWIGAEREWEKVPPCLESWKGLGEARLRQGHAREAMDALRAALQLQPADRDLRLLLAEAFVMQGRSDDGLALFDAILRESPGDARALSGRSNVFAMTRRFEDAERDGRAAVRADPNSYEAWLGLGQIQGWKGKYDEAFLSYASAAKAARGKNRLSRALGRQALMDAWRKRTSEAAQLYGKAVSLDPTNVEAWMGLSDVLEWDGKFKEARLAVEKAVQADPYNEAAHQRLELLEWAR